MRTKIKKSKYQTICFTRPVSYVVYLIKVDMRKCQPAANRHFTAVTSGESELMVKRTELGPRPKPHTEPHWSVSEQHGVSFGTLFTPMLYSVAGFLLPTAQILNTHLSAVYNTWHHDAVTKKKKTLKKVNFFFFLRYPGLPKISHSEPYYYTEIS